MNSCQRATNWSQAMLPALVPNTMCLPLASAAAGTSATECVYTTSSSHHPCLSLSLATGPRGATEGSNSHRSHCMPPIVLAKEHKIVSAVEPSSLN